MFLVRSGVIAIVESSVLEAEAAARTGFEAEAPEHLNGGGWMVVLYAAKVHVKILVPAEFVLKTHANWSYGS